MKNLGFSLLIIIFCALPLNAALAASDDGSQIPEQVTIEHWSCKDVAELARKYDATRKLPDSVVVEGKACSKGELARCLLSVMESVCEKCGKEGCPELSGEDREKLARLHDALKDELSKYEGYLTRREAIAKMLARPEAGQPPFLVRAGVNGFLRGEGAGNFRLTDFSYNPGHGEGRFLYRVKPYVYWHPTDYLDIHVEGQGYGFSGSNQGSNRFSLYQGFIEAKTPESETLALKAGRQEFSYGSTFILGPNSFYDGLAFDALRLRARPWAPLSIDLLGGWYAQPFSAGLKGDLEGVYTTYALNESDAIEGYVFRDTGQAVHHAVQQLYIWGLRAAAAIGAFSFEIEPVYESGEVFNPETGAGDDVSAYGGHVDLAAETSSLGIHTKLIGGFAIGSGSKDAASGVNFRNEFRNPGNDSALMGDMTVVGDLSGITVAGFHASGIQDYTLGLSADIFKWLNFSATGHYFLANAVPDGLSRDIGLETDFTATCNINDRLTLIVGYDHFFTGDFFREASGRGGDIDYGYAMLQFDYGVSRPKGPRLKAAL